MSLLLSGFVPKLLSIIGYVAVIVYLLLFVITVLWAIGIQLTRTQSTSPNRPRPKH